MLRGEGVAKDCELKIGIRSLKRPHPYPLPKGEGAEKDSLPEGEGEVRIIKLALQVI